MLNKRQTARFCSQLKMMLASGMPLLEALKTRAGFESAGVRIAEGEPLSEAMANSLPPLAIGSLRAAERSGSLEETLGQLAKYFENKAELEEKLKGALVYPAFVLVLCLAVILVMLFFILPGFNDLFADLGTELPVFTRVVLNGSNLLSSYWFLILGFFSVAGGMAFKFKRSRPASFERAILKIPFLGKIYQQELVIQGLSTLGSLLNSGTPILEALTITGNSSRGLIFKEQMFKVKEKIENGGKLSEAFLDSKFFTSEVIQMLKVGENAGQVAEMLLSVADFQAKEREVELKHFTSLLEPALTLSVGLVAGFIVLAVFLPLVNMVSSIK